ncbi:MAG: hypothetical protein ABJB17_04430, partial [Burkholderiales bacterium]
MVSFDLTLNYWSTIQHRCFKVLFQDVRKLGLIVDFSRIFVNMDAQVKGSTVAAPAATEKAKALAAALAQIEKQFGKGTIMRLG